MKNKILLLLASIFLCYTIYGQKYWNKERQFAPKLSSIYSTPLNTEVVRDTNQIIETRSANVVEQWNKLGDAIIPEGEEAYAIKMVDENIIWMGTCPNYFGEPAGTAPNIFKSVDGGLSWEQFQIANTEGYYIADIAPVNDLIAYAVLWGPDFVFGDFSQDAIYKTIDGGLSWEQVSSYSFGPVYVHFFNELEGWVFGFDDDFIVMSTTKDGGVTWEHAGGDDWMIPEGRTFPVQDDTKFVGTWLYTPSSNYDVKGSTIIVGGTNYWISYDKGYNWESLESPIATEEGLIHGLVGMKDSLTFMFASNLTIDFDFKPATTYATVDGGQTWTRGNLSINPSAIAYLPGTTNDFIISGIDQGFDPSFGFGITGTARTSNLEDWGIIDNTGLQAIHFTGENQGVGAFANYPGFSSGLVYSWGEQIRLDYDAIITRENDYTYTIVTLNHLKDTVSFDYLVQNTGINSLDNTQLTLEVLKDNELIHTESQELNIAETASDKFNFSYLPEEVGFYQFNITGTHPEVESDLFRDSRFLEVSETTLAKDNGQATLAFALGADHDIFPSGYFGSEFELLIDDQLVAISTVVDHFLSDSSATFNFLIKAIDENGQVVGTDIYKSTPIVAREAFTEDFSFVQFDLPEPITLTPGRYIFAVGQDEPSGDIAFDLTDRVDSGSWMFSPVGFDGGRLPWTNFPDNPTLMIRPHFEAAMSTSTLEERFVQSIPLTIFPNPFQEELNILLEYFEESEVHIQIFDLVGKQWTNLVTNNHSVITHNVSALPNGLYLLKLQSGAYERTVKVLKE